MKQTIKVLVLSLMTLSAFAAKKTLRYSETGAPTNLDPVQSATLYSNLVVTAVYDTLYEYKYLERPYKLKSNLADGMPKISKDGLTYTFKIKKGVEFTDNAAFKDGKGREVTANDFVYSMKRHFDPKNKSQGAWLWQGRIVGLDDWKKNGADYSKEVAGLKALDSHTIQLKLVKPFPQVIYTFAMGFSALVPREAVEKYGKEFSIKPVGSGPFQMKSFSTQRAVLTKNPKYRKEVVNIKSEGYDEKLHGKYGIKKIDGKQLPIVDEVVVDFIKVETARWNSFTKGDEVQYAGVPIEQTNTVMKSLTAPYVMNDEYNEKYYMSPDIDFGFVYGAFNMEDKDFGLSTDPKINDQNRALRCAVRKAFNWPQRIKRFYNGIGDAFAGVVPPTVSGYNDLGPSSVTQDIAGAKKLLKDGGWNAKNLPVFEYSGVSSVRTKQFFDQFKSFLKKIGWPANKVKLKQFATFGDYNKALKQRKLKYFAMGWGLDYPDAENLMQLFYGPNASPGANSSNYQNPKYDALYEKAAVMQPSPARTKIYGEMSKMLVDDCVAISGFSRTRFQVWHKNTTMFPSRNVIGNVFKYVDVSN